MNRVKLNLRGLEEVATSGEMHAAIDAAAERVAANVESQGIRVSGTPGDDALPVKVHSDTTHGMTVNRASARVVLAHASGLAVQAKHGALTKAALMAGLRVKGE